MRATLRTVYALIIVSILFVLAITPFNPVEAATAGEVIGAGHRAMNAMDATHKAWLRTLGPADAQLVLCSQLAVEADDPGLVALDCEHAINAVTSAHMAGLVTRWQWYQAGYGYLYPTPSDVAKVEPQDRIAVRHAIACTRIRDKIAAQAFLRRQGSSGYWNVDQLRVVERQQCGDRLAAGY